MFSLYGLQITRIYADSDLVFACDNDHGADPLCRLVDFDNMSILDHLIKLLNYLSLECYWLSAHWMHNALCIWINLDAVFAWQSASGACQFRKILQSNWSVRA